MPDEAGLDRTGLLDVFLARRAQIESVLRGRTGDAALAADLVQDLYFRLERISERLPNETEAYRYLLRMALNASIDHHRTEKRRAELLSGVACLFDGAAPGPERLTVARDTLREIDVALEALPDKARDVLYLSRVEGLTHQEIAERLGVSRSLVEKYVVRALLHCRAQLADHDH